MNVNPETKKAATQVLGVVFVAIGLLRTLALGVAYKEACSAGGLTFVSANAGVYETCNYVAYFEVVTAATMVVALGLIWRGAGSKLAVTLFALGVIILSPFVLETVLGSLGPHR